MYEEILMCGTPGLVSLLADMVFSTLKAERQQQQR